MKTVRAVNIEKQLKGCVVLQADTVSKLGEVLDVIIHPSSGKTLALLIGNGTGIEQVLPAEDFVIHGEAKAVVALGPACFEAAKVTRILKEGVRAIDDLLTSEIVTQDGLLLGRINGLYLQSESFASQPVVYHVTASFWQRLIGGGVYLTGDVVCHYSRTGSRLIVPADTKWRHARHSLSDSLGSRRKAKAA